MSETESRIASPSPAEPVPDEFDVLCEQCGYSLIGLIDSNRCPECGKEFEPLDLPLARIPWLYRRRLGMAQAYWRTVRYVIRDPVGFAKELCRPVRISAADARAFRRRTIWIAVLSWLVPLGLVLMVNGINLMVQGYRLSHPLVRESVASAMGVLLLGGFTTWLVFTLGTDLPTFIWKGISDRSFELAPVHHYASAPLALMPVFGLVTLVVYAMELLVRSGRSDGAALAVIPIAAILEVAILIWVAANLMRAATGYTDAQQAKLVWYLIFHWTLMAVLGLLIVGAAYQQSRWRGY